MAFSGFGGRLLDPPPQENGQALDEPGRGPIVAKPLAILCSESRRLTQRSEPEPNADSRGGVERASRSTASSG
jgi:hypothetical protein